MANAPQEGRDEGPRDTDEIYEDVAEDHDPVTTREAFEQEVAEEGRSDEAEDVGEHNE